MSRRTALVVLVAGCGFSVSPGTTTGPGDDARTDDARTDDAAATTDAPPDGPAACGSCDDGDPCTTDTCTNGTCAHAMIDVPLGCSGPLFRCPNEPTCYVRCTAATTWGLAEASCATWGGHLVTVTSTAESTCIGGALATGPARAWIGYAQSPLGSEPLGGWGWVSGSTSTFTDWIGGQPNNAGDQDCAFAERPDGRWYDHGCLAIEHGYLCEK